MPPALAMPGAPFLARQRLRILVPAELGERPRFVRGEEPLEARSAQSADDLSAPVADLGRLVVAEEHGQRGREVRVRASEGLGIA